MPRAGAGPGAHAGGRGIRDGERTSKGCGCWVVGEARWRYGRRRAAIGREEDGVRPYDGGRRRRVGRSNGAAGGLFRRRAWGRGGRPADRVARDGSVGAGGRARGVAGSRRGHEGGAGQSWTAWSSKRARGGGERMARGREGTLEASVGSWDDGVAAAREKVDSL